MTKGERLRYVREYRKMSQDDLAKSLGYKSRSTINKIEMNTNEMPLDKILKAAEILEVNKYYLMGLNDEPMLYETNKEIMEAWEGKNNPNGRLAEEAKLAAHLNAVYGPRAAEFVAAFDLMNEIGQDKIMEAIEKLKQNPENRKEPNE